MEDLVGLVVKEWGQGWQRRTENAASGIVKSYTQVDGVYSSIHAGLCIQLKALTPIEPVSISG